MRQCRCDLSFTIKLHISINMVHLVSGKNPLSPLILAADCKHGSPDLPTGQIGYHSCTMWKIPDCISCSTTLIINHKKVHILRTELDHKGKQVGLKQFALTGTCCSRNQSMRSMKFFVHIQIYRCTLHSFPNHCLKTLFRSCFLPADFTVKFFDPQAIKEFQEIHIFRNSFVLSPSRPFP